MMLSYLSSSSSLFSSNFQAFLLFLGRKWVEVGLVNIFLCSAGMSFSRKTQNFGHIMSKMGLPYLPSTLVWTKISLDKYSPVSPIPTQNMFGHLGNKVCSFIEYIGV